MKVTIELPDTTYRLLQVLDSAGSVETVLQTLADHAQQGVYRPGSWEREWLCQVFIEDWAGKLEPGDPYGRTEPVDFKIFERPRGWETGRGGGI